MGFGDTVFRAVGVAARSGTPVRALVRVVRSYVWGEGVDRLLAVRIGARTYAALADAQGTVWGFADGGGRIAARWTYDAWGNVLSEEIAEGAGELRAVRYRFQGRERSAATGLIHFRARWYDPETGRWLSPDPIGLEGGLNLHAFCANDPVNYTDPSGCLNFGFPYPIIDPQLLMTWNGPYWHHAGRDKLNFPLPSSAQEASASGFCEQPSYKSIYHDNHKGKPEVKFVHPDGREVVFDGDTGEVVTDLKYKGTYNYVNPPDHWYRIDRALGHFFADMLPYYIWGN